MEKERLYELAKKIGEVIGEKVTTLDETRELCREIAEAFKDVFKLSDVDASALFGACEAVSREKFVERLR